MWPSRINERESVLPAPLTLRLPTPAKDGALRVPQRRGVIVVFGSADARPPLRESVRMRSSRLVTRLAFVAGVAIASGCLAGCEEAATGDLGMAGSVRASHALNPDMLALME